MTGKPRTAAERPRVLFVCATGLLSSPRIADKFNDYLREHQAAERVNVRSIGFDGIDFPDMLANADHVVPVYSVALTETLSTIEKELRVSPRVHRLLATEHSRPEGWEAKLADAVLGEGWRTKRNRRE